MSAERAQRAQPRRRTPRWVTAGDLDLEELLGELEASLHQDGDDAPRGPGHAALSLACELNPNALVWRSPGSDPC